MSLKKLKFAKTNIDTPMGQIALRGINLLDVRTILVSNPVEAELIYNKATSMSADIDAGKATDGSVITEFLGLIIQTMPKLVARLIALASDEDDDEAVEIAGKLPVDVQLECLAAIANLTFVMEGGARNFIARIGKLMKEIMPRMKAPAT